MKALRPIQLDSRGYDILAVFLNGAIFDRTALALNDKLQGCELTGVRSYCTSYSMSIGGTYFGYRSINFCKR